MTLTYLAVTGGILLATIVVYALLSWRRTPAQTPPDVVTPVEPEAAPAEPPTRSKRRAGKRSRVA